MRCPGNDMNIKNNYRTVQTSAKIILFLGIFVFGVFSEAFATSFTITASAGSGGSISPGTTTVNNGSNQTFTFTSNSGYYVSQITINGTATNYTQASPGPSSYTFSNVTAAKTIAVAFARSVPPMTNYCVNSGATVNITPNVLIILANSNSSDEDFVGNAVGSYSPTSKSVSGRSALINLINTYSNVMNIGLMTFRLPASNNPYYIYNSAYFASYNQESYCPNPPSNCVNYCINSDSADQTACQTACQAQNSSFNATYLLEPGTLAVGNPLRTTYCALVYPKTIAITNPAAPSNYIYYSQALPFYDSSPNDGTLFIYSPAYSLSTQSSGAGQGPYNTYNYYSSMTGTSDSGTLAGSGTPGYSGLVAQNEGLVPTDSDVGLGYFNFGQRLFQYYVGPTWFANTSPGNGYLQMPIAANNSFNTQENALVAKLGMVDSSADYMSCTNTANPNACSYVINAGLTPTAGTFKSAYDYFSGSKDYQQNSIQYTSPIQYMCQKNFIVFVTDGLPSADQNGNSYSGGNFATIMPSALTSIGNLRCPTMKIGDSSCLFTENVGGTVYPFDVQTYVLGEGLTATDKGQLDLMAQAGGTTSANTANPGHAFYADNPEELVQSLNSIFLNIANTAASGTAASLLTTSQGSGVLLSQAVFYPLRQFGSTVVDWTSELQTLWYYLDPSLQSSVIMENDNNTTTKDFLNISGTVPPGDYELNFRFDTTQLQTVVDRCLYNGTGICSNAATTYVNTVNINGANSLWQAGSLLWARNAVSVPRTIYTTLDSQTLTSFTGPTFSPSSSTVQSLLQASNATAANNIINYVQGIDQAGFRSRTVTIGGSNGVWKLGDIVDSSPRVEAASPLNQYNLQAPLGYGDTSYGTFLGSFDYLTRNLVYASANDGMLHAFELGTLDVSAANTAQKAILCDDTSGKGNCEGTVASTTNLGSEQWAFIPNNALPYLTYMTNPGYCHIFSVDGPLYLFDASINQPANCQAANYYDCPKQTSIPQNQLNLTQTSWETVLIGSMGMGGASSYSGASCSQCVTSPLSNGGLSSYFALNVTEPLSPSLMWEFSNPALGFSMAGPAIVRISSTTVSGSKTIPINTTNGHWFAVFASGPTGPINSSSTSFMGKSDQDLLLFIVDLPTGTLLRTIDTGIPNAFATSDFNAPIDTDRWNRN